MHDEESQGGISQPLLPKPSFRIVDYVINAVPDRHAF